MVQSSVEEFVEHEIECSCIQCKDGFMLYYFHNFYKPMFRKSLVFFRSVSNVKLEMYIWANLIEVLV